MDKYPPSPESLRKYLKANNINGFQAAEMLSVSRRTIGYWMRGTDHKGNEITIPYTCWYCLRTKVEGKPPD